MSSDKNKITNFFTPKNNNNSNNNNNNNNKRKQIERSDTIIDNTQLDYISTANESSSSSSPSSNVDEPTQIMDNNDDLPKQYNSLKKSKNSNTTTTTTTTTSSTASNSNNNNNNNNYKEDIEDIDYFKLEDQGSPIPLIPLDGEEYNDTWGSEYVKLPCSKNNVYRVTVQTTINRQASSSSLSGNANANGNGNGSFSASSEGSVQTITETKYKSKWYLINTNLQQQAILNSEQFESVVKSYNQNADWNFQGLHDFFETELTESETKEFFGKTLPKIIKLALQIPFLCARPIPLLRKGVDRQFLLSQKQVSSLLANAFLCTFPRQGTNTSNRYYNNNNNQSAFADKYPSFNFNSLYTGKMIPSRAAKLKCILHYFKCVTETTPNGTISFHRQVFEENEIPDWEKSTHVLRDLTPFTEGTIEDNGIGMLQVDFANKSLGGGVLGYGCVQEEIRFVINPELLVTCLFTSVLEENEAVIITGSQRFSKYSGYGDSFQWDGPYIDNTPLDQYDRRLTSIVAMDAIKIHGNPFNQFSPQLIERELNKSLCGFSDRISPTIPPPVATGNWGCGVFGGDKHLKSIIQLMSSSQAGRDLVYYSFGDQTFTEELSSMVNFLHSKNVKVGQLYKALWEYYKLMSHTKSNLGLFSYLDAHFS